VPDLSVTGDKSDLVVIDPHDLTTTRKLEAAMQSLNQLPMVTNLAGAKSASSGRLFPARNRRTNKKKWEQSYYHLKVESAIHKGSAIRLFGCS
jgi:hypothetical protein